MKKKISCALLALLLAGQVMGAISVEAGETKTTYTAVERLAPQFEEIGGISDDGILTVKKGDKWGFVDVTGKTVLDYKYDYASEMVDGIAVVGYINDSEPYVNKETGESYEYYDLYLIDKTGKETQLFETLEQNYRLDAQWNKTDENGNFILEVRRDNLENIEIKYGVVYIDKLCFYRYDGTPIYIQDREYIKNNYATFMKGDVVCGADTRFLDVNQDGIISVQVIDVTDRSPHILHIDLDGNIVQELPTMSYGAMGSDVERFQYTADEYGICYAYAPEDGYTVAYNQHYSDYYTWERNDEVTYNSGYGVMNADGEWVIEPVYDNVRNDYDQPIHDGYVSLMNQDGYYGLMTVEGEIVIPFEYSAVSPMINGYTLLYKEEGATGVITDANRQAYTIADADGNALDVDSLYMTNAENNVRRITTTDGKSYLLSGTPDGTTFKTIENTENMSLAGWRSSSGKYWTTKTDAGYGVIEIVIEETEVTPAVEEKAEETKLAETEKVEEVAEETKEEVVEETEAPAETKPATSKFFPIRNGSAAKSKQTKRTNMSMNGLSAVVRH